MSQIDGKSAVIYCRVSSEEQIEGTSLQTQERLCREYAAAQGLRVLAVFVEPGESAKTANRTKLREALAYCQRQRVGVFVVHKLDRFARNQEDHVTIRALLRKHGTELRSVTEPIDESAIGRAMEGMLSVFAELDNNIRSERTKAGLQARVAQGVWVWPAPLGYHRPAEGGNIAPDPDVAPLIRRGFEEYAKGVYSYERLAAFLNARGLRSRRGFRIRKQHVEQMLSNSLYCGVMKVWEQDFQGSFEPIVPRQLFNKCQAIRRPSPANAAPRSFNNPNFPLRSFIYCPECSRRFTGSSPRSGSGRKVPYYHHYHKPCSLSRYVPKDELEQKFTRYLARLAFDRELSKAIEQLAKDVWEAARQSQTQTQTAVRREISILEGERQRIFELHRAGVYTDQDFVEQRRLLQARLESQKLLLEEEQMDWTGFSRTLRRILAFFEQPAATWKRLEYTEKIQFQRRIFPSGVFFDGNELRTPRLSRIYRLKELVQGPKSGLVPLARPNWNEIVEDVREWEEFLDSVNGAELRV